MFATFAVLSLTALLAWRAWPSQPEDPRQTAPPFKRRAAQLILAIPGLVFLSLAVHGTRSDHRRMREYERLRQARTARAEGTLTDVREPVPGSRSGTIAFVTGSGREIRSPWKSCPPEEGMKLAIAYDPEHPENNAVGDRPYGFLEVFFGHIGSLAAGCYMLWLAVRAGRPSAWGKRVR